MLYMYNILSGQSTNVFQEQDKTNKKTQTVYCLIFVHKYFSFYSNIMENLIKQCLVYFKTLCYLFMNFHIKHKAYCLT